MKPIINITKNAWKKMEIILKQSNNKHGFIFGATSGGCNGFNFDLRLINESEFKKIQKKNPNISENKNSKCYIDPISEIYLIGTTIDFVNEDFSKGIFESKFTYNIDRQIASSCGCGVSFRPKNI